LLETIETQAAYDLNNNLIAVLQNGSRQRVFTYNLLSQLLTSANPESGTIAYTYDNNGNLYTKIAPAPNQTAGSATVTTTFTYDQLNRLTQKSFSEGHDSHGEIRLRCHRALGLHSSHSHHYQWNRRRTSMCDAAGAEAWSYSAMGRTLAERPRNVSVLRTRQWLMRATT